MNIKHNPSLSPESIKTLEKRHNAKYICDSCMKDHNGNWINQPFSFFYTDEPHPDGSNYFAYYHDMLNNRMMITNGASILEQTIDGAVADNGDIIYSRCRHDCVTSEDGSVMIDGGRDYTRTDAEVVVHMKVNVDKLEVV